MDYQERSLPLSHRIKLSLSYPTREPSRTFGGLCPSASRLENVFGDIKPPMASDAVLRVNTGGSSRLIALKNWLLPMP